MSMPIKRDLRHNSFSNTVSGTNKMRQSVAADDVNGDDVTIKSAPMMDANERDAIDGMVMDDLVNTLTNKLCLKSKSCHTICKQNRMSPYQIHNNSAVNGKYQCAAAASCYCLNCKYFKNSNGSRKTVKMNDPYELMQELLKEGSLIKEAVKRLQLGNGPAKRFTQFYDYSDEENISGNENEINLLNS